MALWDKYLADQEEKDKVKMETLLQEVKAESMEVGSLDTSLLKELRRKERKVEALLRKLERLVENAQKHLNTQIERNHLWREEERKKIIAELQSEKEEAPNNSAYYCVKGLITIVNSISMSDPTSARATDFEAMCFSILLPMVLERALRVESEGYLLQVEVDLEDIISEGKQLLELIRDPEGRSLMTPEVWDEAFPLVLEWWEDKALPKFFGGVDPDWKKTEFLSREFMEKWQEDRTIYSPYSDCLDLIRSVYEEKS